MFEGHVDSLSHCTMMWKATIMWSRIWRSLWLKSVFKAYNKVWANDVTHIFDQRCSDRMARPPCAFSDVRLPCCECNRHFMSRAFFDNHKQSTANRKFVCELKRCCTTCGVLSMSDKNERNKRFFDMCKQNSEVGHLFYMRPLKNVFLTNFDKVLYDFTFRRLPKIRVIRSRRKYTLQNPSACYNIALVARKWKTTESVWNAARGGTRFVTTR